MIKKLRRRFYLWRLKRKYDQIRNSCAHQWRGQSTGRILNFPNAYCCRCGKVVDITDWMPHSQRAVGLV